MNISLCVTSKNRTIFEYEDKNLNLFENNINSITKAFSNIGCAYEYVIYDWGSTDTDYKWLPDTCRLIVNTTDNDKFSRGYGLNRAAEEAKYDNILFLDTDMLITESFILNCFEALEHNMVYFPICWSVGKNERNQCMNMLGSEELLSSDSVHTNYDVGGWRPTGKGISCMKKQIWEDTGKIPEYWQWGSEDGDFYGKIQSKGYDIKRENDCGLVHQWHPDARICND